MNGDAFTPAAPGYQLGRCQMRAIRTASHDCTTGKKGYRTARKALRALEAIRRNPHATERSIYRCPLCGDFHLTSQPWERQRHAT